MLSTLGALEAGVTSRAPSRSSRSASRRAFATVRAAATELEQLATMSKLVVDSGDFLLMKGATGYEALARSSLKEYGDAAADALAVAVGCDILTLVPGRVSTETDPRNGSNENATVSQAMRLIDLYSKKGIDKSRILIKVAATYEGIRAVEKLQASGINCNVTLIFSVTQAVACADAGATLISPFVGRILDWEIAHAPKGTDFSGAKDPGVMLVTAAFHALKAGKYGTEVMAASFRNIDEIRLLAGCDALTMGPAFFDQLAASTAPLKRALSRDGDHGECPPAAKSKEAFQKLIDGDAMASELLSGGIAGFSKDATAFEGWLAGMAAPV